MAAENSKLKVFLCHSKDDKPKVRELYQRLVANGFDAWLDEEKLMPGQDWDLEIRRAVRESDVVVVCLSNGSVTKAGYVQKEIRFALDVADEQPEGAIFLIPIKLEECSVPSRLNKWQWVNAFEETGLKRLFHSLTLRESSIGSLIARPSSSHLLPITKTYIDIIEPELVKIPEGRFLMGSTREQADKAIKDAVSQDWVQYEQPQHTVELSEYFIGRYTITNREYQVFVKNAKYVPPRDWDGDQFPTEKDWHPVVYVSWNDAVAYCKWLKETTGKEYRLPTEAEWEKAARGKKGRIYPWGNYFDKKNANTFEIRPYGTSVVGRFSPHGDSPYGCADMIGNVWEWCNDWFNEYEYKHRQGLVVKNPQGHKTGDTRVLRGGSRDDYRGANRCAHRTMRSPSYSGASVGFRVALSMRERE